MRRNSWILPCLSCWFAVYLLRGVVGCGADNRPARKVANDLVHSPGNTTYYVDSEHGNDHSEGTTPDNAWKTLSRVNDTLFAPGDRILFKAGGRFSGQLAPRGSGTARAPITVDVFGQGVNPRIEAGGRFHEALFLKNQDYWEINNLELTNTGLTREKFQYGVRVAAWDFGTMRHIHLKNLFVHDVNGSLTKEDRGEGHGIIWENGGGKIPSRFDDLLIEACHLLRTDRNGICGYSENSNRDNWFPSLNVVIRNNLLEDIGGDGIKVWGCNGALVEHNRLFGANRRAPDYSAGIWPWSSDNTLIQSNEVTGVAGTRDGQAFDSDGNCQGTVFQYNYSHDNEGGFMLICSAGKWTLPSMVPNTGTVVRYNISQNDRARTFHISGPVKSVTIYNNDFFVKENLAVPIFLFTDWNGWPDGVFVANNIFYVEGRARYSHGTGRNDDGAYQDAPGFGSATRIKFENNAYYGNHENRPSDPKSMTADPMLLDPGDGTTGLDSLEGYKLKVNSPCIRAGVPIPKSGGRDFWGHVVESDHPSIGAHYRN